MSATDSLTESLPTGYIVTVQTGRAQKRVTPEGKEWRSAIVKATVEGPIAVGSEGLAGDQQADLKHHGGPTKAVCCYFSIHYPGWIELLDREMTYGAFGENLTIGGGLTEDDLCIGDTLTVGEVILQVSQPRIPCSNVAKRWDSQRLPILMEETGRTGFYCRVLQTGAVMAGDTLTVTERINPGWTVMRANRILYGNDATRKEITELSQIPAFTDEWRRVLGRRL